MPKSDEFETLVTTYIDDMYALAMQLTGSKDSAQDLVQDLFISLSLKKYANREIHRPKAWLASILYRIFVDQWRRHKNAPVQFGIHVIDENEIDPTTGDCYSITDPVYILELEDEQDRIHEAMQVLNERQHQIVMLHDIEGYTLEEIGEILVVPVGTVKSNLHRAREKVRIQLSNTEDNLFSGYQCNDL